MSTTRDSALHRKIDELEQKLQAERAQRHRLAAELGGTKTALRRYQIAELKRKQAELGRDVEA